MPSTIRLHRVLRATPERIYRAFLDPDAKAKWLPPNGFTGKVHEIEARVGGRYRMSFTNFSTGTSHSFAGQFLELLENQRIRYEDTFDDPGLPGTIEVTVTLTQVSCGTELSITRRRPGRDPSRSLLPRLAGVADASGEAGRSGDSGRLIGCDRDHAGGAGRLDGPRNLSPSSEVQHYAWPLRGGVVEI